MTATTPSLRVRRRLLAALTALLAAPRAFAQTASDRPLKIIVPLPPGGASDAVVRLLAQKLSEGLGQTVITDNRPGAGTVIGTQAVARAPADGLTIGMVISAHAINPTLRKQMPYDTLGDLAEISLAGYFIVALVAHPSLRANNAAELIGLAKAQGDALHYASLGVGTSTHLAGELFNTSAGTKIGHVPYNGSAPAYQDLLAGRIPLGYVTLDSALPHLRAGKLKMIGLTNAKRVPHFPDYPVIAETLPGFEALSFFGFVAPAATPTEAVKRLSAEFARVLRLPEIVARFDELAMVPVGSTPEEFDRYLRTEITRYAAVVKRVGLTLE
jgi:tripartite-type tricarboxylate transporter receptor subunit TctC